MLPIVRTVFGNFFKMPLCTVRVASFDIQQPWWLSAENSATVVIKINVTFGIGTTGVIVIIGGSRSNSIAGAIIINTSTAAVINFVSF